MLILHYTFLNIIAGLSLLFLGRYFIWLFIFIVCYLFGLYIVDYFYLYYPDWFIAFGERLYWLFNIENNVLNIIDHQPVHSTEVILSTMENFFVGFFILIALIFRKSSVFISGIIGGGAVLFTAFRFFIEDPLLLVAIALFAGSAIGGLLCVMFYEYTVVFLTSVLGALLFLEPFYVGQSVQNLIIIMLVLAGMAMQVFLSSKKAKSKKMTMEEKYLKIKSNR